MLDINNSQGCFIFSQSQTSNIIVPERRLNYASGDIAKALDSSAPERGNCKVPVTIYDAYFVITAGLGRSIDLGYSEMIGYQLVSINEYSGDIVTFAQAYKRQKYYLDPIEHRGIILRCFNSDYIMGDRALISSYDSVFDSPVK